MADTQAIIIVVPRKGFNLAKRSLESIYQRTNSPFTLNYVDVNSPKQIMNYLELTFIVNTMACGS